MIGYPYAIISDVHCHNWSAFSHIHESGINNRLKHILDGIRLAVADLKAAGGSDLIITGDLFHTRGNVKPSVLNPVFDLFRTICADGITIHAIPGNHDLEGKESDRLGNALTVLSGIENFNVYDEPTLVGDCFFIPWMEEPQELLKLANEKANEISKLTLFCHVGLNGVIPSVMGGVINPEDFSKEFKYVFSGHFHNHVGFDSRVYSVGALNHQTWSDVGSLSGFLIVYEDKVVHQETFAPKFIDVHAPPPKMIRNGNYFRIKGELPEEAALELTKKLKDYGALGVIDQSTRPTIIEKTHSAINLDLGVEKAVSDYCDANFGDKADKVKSVCSRFMN